MLDVEGSWESLGTTSFTDWDGTTSRSSAGGCPTQHMTREAGGMHFRSLLEGSQGFLALFLLGLQLPLLMLPQQAQSMFRGSKNRESLGLGWCQLLVSKTCAVGTCLYMEPSELYQCQLKRFPMAAGQLGHGPAYLFILSLLSGSEQSPI